MVTIGIKLSPNIGSALVSAMYWRSSELGLSNLHYTSAHPFDALVTGLERASDSLYNDN